MTHKHSDDCSSSTQVCKVRLAQGRACEALSERRFDSDNNGTSVCFSIPREMVKGETLPVLEKEHNCLQVICCACQVLHLDETESKILHLLLDCLGQVGKWS